MFFTRILTIVTLALLIGCGEMPTETEERSSTETEEFTTDLGLAESDGFSVEDAGPESAESAEAEESQEEDPNEESKEDELEEAITEAAEAEIEACIDRIETIASNRWRVQRFLDRLSDDQISAYCERVLETYGDAIDTLKEYQDDTVVVIGARALTASSPEKYEHCGLVRVYVLNEETKKFEVKYEKDHGPCTGAMTYGAGLAGVLLQTQDAEGETFYRYGTAGLLYGPAGAVVGVNVNGRRFLFAMAI